MQRRGIGGGSELIPETRVGKHLGQLGKQLQMLLVSCFGYQKNKNQPDQFSIRRIELYGCVKPDKSANRCLESFDAAMGNCYTLTQTGRTQLLTREQGVVNRAAGNALMVFKKNAGLLENTFLAAGI